MLFVVSRYSRDQGLLTKFRKGIMLLAGLGVHSYQKTQRLTPDISRWRLQYSQLVRYTNFWRELWLIISQLLDFTIYVYIGHV